MGSKRCRFCKHRDANRKIPATACNKCRTDNTNNPFGSEFIERYYDYCWDRKYLKDYINAKKHWMDKGVEFKESWKPVPMDGE